MHTCTPAPVPAIGETETTARRARAISEIGQYNTAFMQQLEGMRDSKSAHDRPSHGLERLAVAGQAEKIAARERAQQGRPMQGNAQASASASEC